MGSLWRLLKTPSQRRFRATDLVLPRARTTTSPKRFAAAQSQVFLSIHSGNARQEPFRTVVRIAVKLPEKFRFDTTVRSRDTTERNRGRSGRDGKSLVALDWHFRSEKFSKQNCFGSGAVGTRRCRVRRTSKAISLGFITLRLFSTFCNLVSGVYKNSFREDRGSSSLLWTGLAYSGIIQQTVF